jgi:hypothetical protein
VAASCLISSCACCMLSCICWAFFIMPAMPLPPK